VSQKCTKFETVGLQLKIIRFDFDDIWQKYSKDSRIEFACFSFFINFSSFKPDTRLPRVITFTSIAYRLLITHCEVSRVIFGVRCLEDRNSRSIGLTVTILQCCVRLSSVMSCIVAKRCVLEQKLRLTPEWWTKPYTTHQFHMEARTSACELLIQTTPT